VSPFAKKERQTTPLALKNKQDDKLSGKRGKK
jgi:hypothetical protein